MPARPVSRRSVLKGAAGAIAAGTALRAGLVGPSAAAASTSSRPGGAATDGNTPLSPVLWYSAPAQNWADYTSSALPIGNGFHGAMVYGGVAVEQIQFNEHTLWIGGPGATTDPEPYNFGNWYTPRPGVLDAVRTSVAAQATETVRPDDNAETVAAELCQAIDDYGCYQSFGDVFVELTDAPTVYTGYRRQLDLSTAVAHTEYTADGVRYTRDSFASYPDRVVVTRFAADESGRQSFTVRFSVPDNRTATVRAEDGRITVWGALNDNGLRYFGQAQVLLENTGGGHAPHGSLTDNADGSVTVTGADSVVLLVSGGTDYADTYPSYRGAPPDDRVVQTLDRAARKSYSRLSDDHLADYSPLYRRVELTIPQPGVDPTLDIDARLNAIDQAMVNESANTDLIAALNRDIEPLLFQFGRYLLIASSRAGSLPANLQGVWNDSVAPPWNADYTTNINLEMNYWAAEVTNLTETTQPLFEFTAALREPGRVTAKQLFGAGGWTAMNHLDPFGYTGVAANASEWSPESTAWLLRSMWEHYQYTGDLGFLRTQAYPLMREHTAFWLDYLVEDPAGGDALVVSPSYSPEHGPFSPGCTYSQTVVRDLLTNTVAASTELRTDADFRGEVQDALGRLDPGLRVGSWGQLQEWRQETWDDPADGHRHISHLYPLFPGTQITPDTPDLFAAARVSLDVRTANDPENGIGWRLALRGNLYAALLDGDTALAEVDHLIWRNVLGNMMNNNPFQIDGNLGITSAMAHMLLRSINGVTTILPALPAAWAPAGSFTGLRGHGGFTFDVAWADGTPTRVSVRSDNGGRLQAVSPTFAGAVKVSDAHGRPVAHLVSGQRLTMATTPGASYTITAMS